MQNVVEILSESFEKALGIEKREDSFSNAMAFLSSDVIGSYLGEALQKIKNSNDREKTLRTLTSYFEGNIWDLPKEL